MLAILWRRKKIGSFLTAAGMGAACWALLRWPRAAAAGVSRGLAVCGQILIPSLLPLLVLTDLFCRCFPAGGKGSRLTEKLFRLPAVCALPLLMGAVGGYPAGAAAIRTLRETGRMEEDAARKLLPYCVNAGPAFLIGTVGAGLMGSSYKGVVLYVCHILASFLLLFLRRDRRIRCSEKLPPSAGEPLSAAFSASVSAASQTMIGMSGYLLLFSGFMSVSDASGLTGLAVSVMNYPFTLLKLSFDLSPLWPAFWEVSVGTAAAVYAPLSAPCSALLAGAAAGWGGLSVHCQIRGIFKNRDAVGRGFLTVRALHALLGGALSGLAFALLPLPEGPGGELAAWSTAVSTLQPVSVSAASAGALLLLYGSFLVNIDRFKA